MLTVALLFFLNTGTSDAPGLRPFGVKLDRLQPDESRRISIGGVNLGDIDAGDVWGEIERCWHNCARETGETIRDSDVGKVAQDTLNNAATLYTGVGNAVEGSWEAITNAAENFGNCMANTFTDNECPDRPSVDDLADWCYLAFGDRFEDGFKAGCWVPELAARVYFGDAEGDDKDRATLVLTAGSVLEYELDVFQNEWRRAARGKLKEHLAIEAGVAFSFVKPMELNFGIDNGLKFDFYLPGMRMDFDATVTVYAERSDDPCSDRDDECRIYLNKGKDRIFSKAFAAGPVPIYIEINAKVFVQATPTFDGKASAIVEIGLSDNGVDLMQAAKLPLHDPNAAVQALKNSVNLNAIKDSLRRQLTVDLNGGLEAEAELEVCVGVELSFHINGVGSSLDIPVCLTAGMEMEASAGVTSGGQIEAKASLVLNALEFDYSIDLPDPSAVIDSVCGFINEHNMVADVCGPVVSCANQFIEDTCEGLGEAWSELQLSLIDGKIKINDEHELWSHSFSLQWLGSRCETKETMCDRVDRGHCNNDFPAVWINERGNWDHQLMEETKGLCVWQDNRCQTRPTFCDLANNQQCHDSNFKAVWGKASTDATIMCEWKTYGL